MFYPRCGLARRIVRSALFQAPFRAFLLFLPILILSGCDLRFSGGSLWGDESSKLGPRIVELGQPVPKGGGRYKVGAPYRINGKLYMPQEVSRYDESGMASWYGELFHGRRTANGEIYDMEALTAAHPTLPLPSYVRVTNLRNGRSLVVRVNDRGPYARDRVIDLSWAVASLLQMRAAGVAPVRVQYIGPAPLSGDDDYERAVLARQPWAGPRVAYASSPAKAIRYRQASQTYRYSVTRSKKTATVATIESRVPKAPAITAQHAAPLPVSRIAGLNAGAKPADKPERQAVTAVDHKNTVDSNDAAARSGRTASLQTGRPEPAPSAKAPAAPKPSVFYVEAGLFSKKRLAERLAGILTEIAPASVEPIKIGNRSVHRVRLGPFSYSEAARAAAERIREAGLKSARVEDAIDG